MSPHQRQYEVHGKSVNLEKFRIHILDVIEVLSDTAQIIADVFALIDENTQDDEDFELVVTSNASPFYDAKTDILSGYAINFQVNTPYIFNTCYSLKTHPPLNVSNNTCRISSFVSIRLFRLNNSRESI